MANTSKRELNIQAGILRHFQPGRFRWNLNDICIYLNNSSFEKSHTVSKSDLRSALKVLGFSSRDDIYNMSVSLNSVLLADVGALIRASEDICTTFKNYPQLESLYQQYKSKGSLSLKQYMFLRSLVVQANKSGCVL